MLNKDEELGCLEILKQNFPELHGRSLVIGLYEFLQPNVDLSQHICRDRSAKEVAKDYIAAQKPYIVLDESEGYKMIFLKGQHIKAQYDVTNARMMGFVEASEPSAEAPPAVENEIVPDSDEAPVSSSNSPTDSTMDAATTTSDHSASSQSED